MRIVLNTHANDPGTRVCITGLHRRLRERGIEAELNDWTHYDRYDVAVFMAYDHDMAAARRANPRIRIAAADPKQSDRKHLDAAREADFLLVSSVEQRDVFYRHNRNAVIYYMFPPMRPAERFHTTREPVVVGYHGNRVHIECMCETATLALNALGRTRPLEFWAIYNIERLGRAHIGVPDSSVVKVRHIQWSADVEPDTEVSRSFYEHLPHVDIGIVPNAIPIRDRLTVLEATACHEPEFMYEPFDHILRFKASCNPGRLYPFAMLGIPVVADFAPSASQFIRDGESGFVVSSAHGWYEAMETLAESAELRNRMAAALRTEVARAYDAGLETFLEFCRKPLRSRPPTIPSQTSAETELARLPRYARPRQEGILRRVWARARRSLRAIPWR
ncbi:MAG: glycosyltransferase [Acidobacteriota bacterium]